MKKIFLTVALGAMTFGLFAQNQTMNRSDYSRWSLGLKGGMDFYRVSPEGKNNMSWAAPILQVEYGITPLYGIGLEAGYFNYDRDASRVGTFDGNTIDATLYGSLNFSNLVSPMRTGFWRNVNMYTSMGLGAAFYNYDVKYNVRELDVDDNDVSMVATFGLDLAYSIQSSWEVGLGAQYRYYAKNNLGGYDNNSLGSDALVVTAQVRYKFGAAKRTHVRNASLQEYFPMRMNMNMDSDAARRHRMEDENLKNQIRNLENELKALENKQEGTVTASFHNVEFRFDSYELTPSAKNVLNQIVRVLKNNTSWSTLRIAGNTDNIGTREVNQTMSENRAKAVKDYLVANGIPASKITTIGYGQTRPIADNNTETGRQQNRRVEFEIRR